MRRLITLGLLAIAALAAARPVSDDGWNPRARKSKRRPPSSRVTAAQLSRGPQYSAGNARPSSSDVVNYIGMSQPNSPNEVAAQDTGQGGGCGAGIQQQLNALNSQVSALKAQLNAILAKVQAEYAAELACSGPPAARAACALTHANNALNYANQSIPIAAQLQGLAGQYSALQAKAQSCGGSGGGGSQASLPAVTLASVMQRYNIPVKGALASSSGNLGGEALQQLETLDEQGEAANWDGRATGMANAMGGYRAAATRVALMAGPVEAGRQLVGKDITYGNPAKAAEQEYLKINYKELGPKYEALAQERSQAADKVATETLNTISAPAPFPATGPPEVPAPEASVLDGLKEKGEEKLTDYIKDKAWDAFTSLNPEQEGMKKAGAIMNAALEGQRDLFAGLQAAVAEMGSASLSTSKMEDLQATLAKNNDNVEEKAKDGFKYVTGWSE